MTVSHRDLADTMLSKISIDEYEPKTGLINDVCVVGFRVVERSHGHDLHRFINNSVLEVLDVELTPNPDMDNYYMVFVELPRNPQLPETIDALIKEVENVSGPMSWKFRTIGHDKHMPWDLGTASDVLRLEIEPEPEPQDQVPESAILEFFRYTPLSNVTVNDKVITLNSQNNLVRLEYCGFGSGKQVLTDLALHEGAIQPMNYSMRKFNHMLGDMEAHMINGHVVLNYPGQSQVLVGKPC